MPLDKRGSSQYTNHSRLSNFRRRKGHFKFMCFLSRMFSLLENKNGFSINHPVFCPLFLDSSTFMETYLIGNTKEIIRENILFLIIWKGLQNAFLNKSFSWFRLCQSQYIICNQYFIAFHMTTIVILMFTYCLVVKYP